MSHLSTLLWLTLLVAGCGTSAPNSPTTGVSEIPASVAEGTWVDPEMAAICEAGCAAQEDYDASEVVAQPGARVGDLTRCPVSGVVFRVQAGQPSFEKDGSTWFTCCERCMEKLVSSPDRFLRGT